MYTNKKTTLTKEICSLWYRPIEILLGEEVYHKEVDIWSLGALMIEIFCKKAPFRGHCEIEQIFEIFKIKGTPVDRGNEGRLTRSSEYAQIALFK